MADDQGGSARSQTDSEGVEFLTIMWFESLESVKQFVGEDYARAHLPAEARAFLS
jgi:hypothetical protein